MSEDVDVAKKAAYEKGAAWNKTNAGMRFSKRRQSTWRVANKGWNTTHLHDHVGVVEKQELTKLKRKPRWGSYATRGTTCNYVSPRAPPGSLGVPPRAFTPCWKPEYDLAQQPTTLEKLRAKRKAMNESVGIDFDGDGNVDETEARLSNLILRAEGATVDDLLNPIMGKRLKRRLRHRMALGKRLLAHEFLDHSPVDTRKLHPKFRTMTKREQADYIANAANMHQLMEALERKERTIKSGASEDVKILLDPCTEGARYGPHSPRWKPIQKNEKVQMPCLSYRVTRTKARRQRLFEGFCS